MGGRDKPGHDGFGWAGELSVLFSKKWGVPFFRSPTHQMLRLARQAAFEVKNLAHRADATARSTPAATRTAPRARCDGLLHRASVRPDSRWRTDLFSPLI